MSGSAGTAWFEAMRAGAFERAWQINDLIRSRGVRLHEGPRHEQVVWDGTPIDGKRLLVRCYHGLGDTIQFIRFAKQARERAREVIFWIQPELIPVVAGCAGVDRFEPLHDGVPDFDYDVDVEVMELPYVLRTTLETLPRTVPYLFRPEVEEEGQQDRKKVGIVWAAGGWDPSRDMPEDALAKLIASHDFEWHALQTGPALAKWRPEWGRVATTPTLTELVQRLCNLDLLVTVDSMPAHLAGALGMPVWVLLKREPDWRWMQNRNDSPWYPTMRLMRDAV